MGATKRVADQQLGKIGMTIDIAEPFHGAKMILFIGDRLLVLRRDHTRGISWPGYLDLPGGGREGGESPLECALRETQEEVGLDVPPDLICWNRCRTGSIGTSWFFAAHLDAGAEAQITFGGEGSGWSLMAPHDFLARHDGIPHFQGLVADYLAGLPSSVVMA